jgi:hypothetical protein
MPPPLAKPPSGTKVIKKHAPGEATQNITIVGNVDTSGTSDPFRRLEETFEAYTLALHLRRGNVVERILRGRAAADELSVNELYNTLSRSISQ